MEILPLPELSDHQLYACLNLEAIYRTQPTKW